MRKGKTCARLLREDYKDAQHPLHSCSTNEDGTFDGKCRECEALHFQSECAQVAAGPEGKQFTTCCARGRAAHIPKPSDVPRELQDLLKSAVFCDNIRRYNAASGFVSFGDASGGTAVARIPGQGRLSTFCMGRCTIASACSCLLAPKTLLRAALRLRPSRSG